MYTDQTPQMALDALEQYFTILESTGYLSYGLVFKLLMLLMADEWLNSQLNFYITEDDYNTISQFIYCLIGNCLIPYPEYKKNVGIVGSPVLMPGNGNRFRITEQDLIRFLESEARLRITEQSYNITD